MSSDRQIQVSLRGFDEVLDARIRTVLDGSQMECCRSKNPATKGCAKQIELVEVSSSESLYKLLQSPPSGAPGAVQIICPTHPIENLLEALFRHGIYHKFNMVAEDWESRLVSYLCALAGNWKTSDLLEKPCFLGSCRIAEDLLRETRVAEALQILMSQGLADETLGNLRLVADELLNNALHHGSVHKAANVTPSGEELDVVETVLLEFGIDDDRALVSVTDRGGRLTREDIRRVLVRQINKEGLLDERGRGLFFARSLSDEMYVHVDPGRRTQVTAVFGRKRNPVIKNLQVNGP